jgi:hypothetical protein
MNRLVPVLLLAAASSFAQLALRDPVRPDALVAGIIEEPRAVAEGGTVRASGHLRVVRAMAGEVAPGTRLELRWEYRAAPGELQEGGKHIPAGPGLLLLARDGESWKPQRFVTDSTAQFAGGYFFPLPGEQVPPQYWAEADARWERKLAHEIWWTLELLAQQHGQALNPARRVLTDGAILARPTPVQRHFRAGAFLLWTAPEPETLEIYYRLAQSPYPNVRTTGLTGLLRAGASGAALEMEKDWPLLAPTLEAIRIYRGLRNIERLPKEDIRALARMALNEVVPPFFESAVAGQLAPLGAEALPFTAAFLLHADARVSGAAVATACLLLKGTLDSPRRWCTVRQSRTEAEVIEFWQDRLRDLGVRPRILPGRYRAAGPELSADAVVAVEDRLWRVALFASKPGTVVTWRPALSNRDREILLPVLERLRREYEVLREAHSAQMQERRRKGLGRDPDLHDEFNRKVKDGRRAALEQLRRELSSAGWTTLEGVLEAIPGIRPDAAFFQ